MDDPRFKKLHSDPRFVRPKANKNKVVVDERFKQLFEEEDASGASKGKQRKIDKYGRPLAKDSTVNELKKYYRMASPDEEEDEEEDAEGPEGTEGDESEEDDEGEDAEEEEDEEEEDAGENEGKGKEPYVDLARGEGLLESSDEEGDSDDDSSDSEGSVTLGPSTLRRRPRRSPSIDLSETEPVFPDEDGELPSDEEEGAPPSKRLAIVNMDWDHLRAADLYRVLASPLSSTAVAASSSAPKSTKSKKFDSKGEEIGPYKPSAKISLVQGRLLKLVIYPSMFGRERMEKEAREGPPVEVFLSGQNEDSDEEGNDDHLVLTRKNRKAKGQWKKRGGGESDSEEEEVTERDLVREQVEEGDEDYDGEALRRYQLERLRYYYAVATFDTIAAAEHVFDEIHGTEFERTANIFDLQFVPDETSFDDDPVHDEATESSIAAVGPAYEGVDFVTDALRHSKVKLTWDADDPHRKTKISNFLASASDTKGKGKAKGAQGMNEDDIRIYLASASEDEEEGGEEEADDFFEEEKPKAAVDRREKLRSLFGLDAPRENDNDWDGGKGAKRKGVAGGDMQITFAPALDENEDQRSGKKGEREETSIEKYKRKEKELRERKAARRKAKLGEKEGPENGGVDTGAGGFDDDFFADDGRDPFADFDAGDEVPDVVVGKGGNASLESKKLSKKARRVAKEAEELANEKAQASLALLVGSDDEDGLEGSKHFDMRSIIKSEKNKGKKKMKLKGKKKAEEKVAMDDFQIDVGDDRFKSLHEDYDFAIDPSNPKFQKTRNMNALLAEGRKRRAKGQDVRAPVGVASFENKKGSQAGREDDGLKKLVESVKRKAGDTGGRGKRTKV